MCCACAERVSAKLCINEYFAYEAFAFTMQHVVVLIFVDNTLFVVILVAVIVNIKR